MPVTRGGDRRRVTSFVDHPLEIDLKKPFTFVAWCNSSDTSDWRTIFSFESPLCHSSLLCLALMPQGGQIFFAYMINAQDRHSASTKAYAPALTWFHFAFVLLDSTTVCLYVNGVQQLTERLNASLFNPEQVEYTLYLCSRFLFMCSAAEANCSRTEYIRW